MINLDRRELFASLGGLAAVALMSHDARADALEHYMEDKLHAQADGDDEGGGSAGEFPSAAQVKDQITTRHYRRGAGGLFISTDPAGKMKMLPDMPAKPTLVDFFETRFGQFSNHCLQSANKARERGQPDEIVLACLLHDTVQSLMRVDHGYYGAQMYEPYVPEITSWAIRYHQPLRFFADEAAGYSYPDLYRRMYGYDYVPAPHVQAAHEMTKKHKWYYAAREVTVSDLYAFDPNAKVSLDSFRDLIAKHFKQPAEGLGYDNSPSAHMWRSLMFPDSPL